MVLHVNVLSRVARDVTSATVNRYLGITKAAEKIKYLFSIN